MYWRRVLEGLKNFFKSFPSFITLTIKNILSINIPLSFSTKVISNKVEGFSLFLFHPFPPKPSLPKFHKGTNSLP